MRKTVLIFLCLFLAIGLPLVSSMAQHLKAGDFLPDTLDGWKKCDSVFHYDPSTIFNYLDKGAEVYLAYDFKDLIVQKYCRDSSQIFVEIYHTGISEDAFGLYSQAPVKQNIIFAPRGNYNSGELRFFKGNCLVRVFNRTEKDNLKKDILQMGNDISKRIKELTKFPMILRGLPKENMIPYSERYFHKQLSLNNLLFISSEDILNLNFKANGVIADYGMKGDTLKYILIQYSDAIEAEKAWQSFNQSYAKGKLKPYLSAVRLSDNAFVGVFLAKTYLGIVLKGKSQENTLRLLGISQNYLIRSIKEGKLSLMGR